MSDAYPTWLDDDEGVRQVRAHQTAQRTQQFLIQDSRWQSIRYAHNYGAGMAGRRKGEEIGKAFVGANEDSSVSLCVSENLLIGMAAQANISYVVDEVTGLAQLAHCRSR